MTYKIKKTPLRKYANIRDNNIYMQGRIDQLKEDRTELRKLTRP